MCMNRRRVVKLLGAAISGASAGCTGLSLNASGRDQSRFVSSVDGQVPAIDGMSATGEVVQSEITSKSQGIIRLGMQWEGDEPIVIGSGIHIPITPVAVSNNPSGLVLDRRDSNLKRSDEDTWITSRQDYGVPLGYMKTEFSPKEEKSMEYSIWGDPDHLNEIKNGRYQFKESLSLPNRSSPSPFDYVATVEIS